MQAIDSDIHRARAIVIDGNATSRSVLTAQLKDMGVAQVRQAARVQDARLAIEEATFDIVLCELNFEGAPMSGQDLLDELRRENLLPYSTVFFVISGEATYNKVVEAAESTIDGFLMKPYSGAALAERLVEARRRKRSLKPVYAALERGDVPQAAALAQARFESGSAYALFAGQAAGELWLRCNEPARAQRLYEAIAGERSLAWARVGVARARLAHGDAGAARRLLELLVVEQPSYADAHDLLARVLVELGEFDPALDAFRTAVDLTPGCLLRLQHYGTLAFYRGRPHEALRMLDRTVAVGRRSKLFDGLTLALLGVLRFDLGDLKGLSAAREMHRALMESFPASRRLQRIGQLLGGLAMLSTRQIDGVLDMARALIADHREQHFDLEAASMAAWLWARLPSGEVPVKEWDSFLRATSLRFCVSKAATEVLASAVRQTPGAEDIVRKSHMVISNLAEGALNRSLSGDAEGAVSMLIDHGEQTLNAKLIDMAAAVTRRHARNVRDQVGLLQRIERQQASFCAPQTHIAGIRRTARFPGGVVLRA